MPVYAKCVDLRVLRIRQNSTHTQQKNKRNNTKQQTKIIQTIKHKGFLSC